MHLAVHLVRRASGRTSCSPYILLAVHPGTRPTSAKKGESANKLDRLIFGSNLVHIEHAAHRAYEFTDRRHESCEPQVIYSRRSEQFGSCRLVIAVMPVNVVYEWWCLPIKL